MVPNLGVPNHYKLFKKGSSLKPFTCKGTLLAVLSTEVISKSCWSFFKASFKINLLFEDELILLCVNLKIGVA